MKSTKIPFVSRSQSQFQHKFLSEYIRYWLLFVFFLFFLWNGILLHGVRFIQTFINGWAEYAISSEVQLEWVIQEWLQDWFIWFKDTSNTEWLLKSTSLDISNYKGKVVIQGTITSSSIDWLYIVDVNTLYQVVTNDTQWLVKKYLDLGVWLQIDINNDQNYFIDLDPQGHILIKDIRTFRPSMKIVPFSCDRRYEDKNCGQIIREGENKRKFDSFISLGSMKYYKINNGLWFVDDKQGKWYHIFVSNDEIMYKLSEYISLQSKTQISSRIYDKLDTLCSNNEFTMTQAEEFEMKQTNNNRFAIIKWKSNKWDMIQCEIYLNDSSKQWINFELINILPV